MNKIQTFQASQLNRNPAKVFGAAEKSPVLISHRNGTQVVLMTKREHEARPELYALLGALIRALSSTHESVAAGLAIDLPWIIKLNDEEIQRCLADLVSSANSYLKDGLALPTVEALTR